LPRDVRESQPAAGPGATRRESSEEILLAAQAGPAATRLELVEEMLQPAPARRTPTQKESAADTDTVPFRPLRRPPMALLCILDDGKDEGGEWVRLRGDRVVIGRGEGDILIPHDSMISGRHAELTRELEEGRFRWYLTDLGSTNGTYLRIGSAFLKHNQELLIGGRRYRFDAAPQGVATPADEAAQSGARGTAAWAGVAATEPVASLVELTAQGEGQRFRLTKPEIPIGRLPTPGGILLKDDPLVSPQHARLFLDKKGRWHIENTHSLNGTWLRIQRVAIEPAGHFLLGEQRFLMRVL
jgi:pSer/pThr/pTyr-binding forkhead associated (FHA) protein